jgi:hypothetical protein
VTALNISAPPAPPENPSTSTSCPPRERYREVGAIRCPPRERYREVGAICHVHDGQSGVHSQDGVSASSPEFGGPRKDGPCYPPPSPRMAAALYFVTAEAPMLPSITGWHSTMAVGTQRWPPRLAAPTALHPLKGSRCPRGGVNWASLKINCKN